MLDVRLLRTDPDGVRASLARRGDDEVLGQLDAAIRLDDRLREVTAERDAARARVNELSKQVGALRRDGRADEAEVLQAESRSLGEAEKVLAVEHDELSGGFRDLLLRIPNLIHPDAPDGKSDADNPVVHGPFALPESFGDHQRVPHWEVGTALGILDSERAVKISGAMFTMTRGLGATMGRALCQLALDRNADAFEEVRPPTLVTTATLTASGQLPKFADDAFAVERDELWCIPTAEVPLTSMFGDEVLAETDLPRRLMAYTPCYRREAGAYGKDMKGMIRQHQFDKVELVKVATPAQSYDELDSMVRSAEEVLRRLGLPYRVVLHCAGDAGFAAAKSYDLEVWLPGQGKYREISSCSNCEAFQARRLDLKYRPAGGGRVEYCHTLNGSGLAVGRTLIAVLENYQEADGSVTVPAALRPYMGGIERITAIE